MHITNKWFLEKLKNDRKKKKNGRFIAIFLILRQ